MILQEDSIQTTDNLPSVNISTDTITSKQKNHTLYNFNANYDVLSKKHKENQYFFVNTVQHIVNTPKVSNRHTYSCYNLFNKTQIKATTKPISIFTNTQTANYTEKSPKTREKKQETTQLQSVETIDNTLFIYNVFEKTEEVPAIQKFNFRTFPIVENIKIKDTKELLLYNKIEQRNDTQKYNFTNTNWATILFVIIFVMLSYSRLIFGKHIQQIVKATVLYSVANKLFSDNSLIINRMSITMRVASFAVFTAITTLLFDFLGYSFVENVSEDKTTYISMWYGYGIFSLITLIVIFVKRNINSILSLIFDLKRVIPEYRFHSNLFINALGIILLVPTITLPYIDKIYVPYIFYAIAYLLLSGYIIRIIRLFYITKKKQFSILFLFLYLCTVEFAPFFILYKLFRNFFI